eukprot:CAMPEP_0197046778 /NCGR_PEP_ID=MMETSP1384-20130603/22415_1 /TAXON_ID=29189 /ORGANISM="Ammonia sp." /LENGTH=231 /DNA_ID=CAMNT_0042478617 /DNA_START=54 /DNA_END=746 /DNA_ORIENTATION=+
MKTEETATSIKVDDTSDAVLQTTQKPQAMKSFRFRWWEWIVWSFLFLMTLYAFVAAMNYYSFSEQAFPPFLADAFKSEKPFLYVHILPASLAIIVSALQFNTNLRYKWMSLHRWLGRIYVVCSLLGAIGGFALSFKSYGGLNTHLAFGTLAVMWFSTTLIALYYIKYSTAKDRVKQHQIWMIRSFAMILAAATLRMLNPLFQINHSVLDAYSAVSWVCWVLNFIVAETYIW